ncbi:uncharacterized protein PgNI_09148 [Pyricularia grisea]|uniref:Kanamycin B dioxygenase n=1 Tax=Pyricularia grisea TaxID=148305 RepID=A0A6P8ARL8_PYRGI|nr:uncharacterized protein PgNI_09148 [Pyricularia grisea]TLD04779.1 hypothetical protein PgNI_09148 [Pyricularia grisea]
MGLDQVELFVLRGDDADGDHGYLNAVSLILGRIINECFGRETVAPDAWNFLFGLLRDWCSALPSRFAPFAREERGLGLALPAVWMLQDCHGGPFIRDEATQQELVRPAMAFSHQVRAARLLFRQHPLALTQTSCRRTMATISQKPTTEPVVIKPSAVEIKNNILSSRNLELAVRHLHADGLVVVEDAVPHADLDALNAKMVPDARYLQSLGEDGPFNYNQGNLQQDPPPVAEYFFPSIFTNKIATQITSSILGPRPKWTFCSANSAMPPSSPDSPPQRQPVHSDADFDHPHHPFALVVNVPLVTMTPRNGSTELWLGTHHLSNLSAQEGAHGERASGRIKQRLLDARKEERGPCQPVVKKGSIVVRDLRLWHAGMPNLSADEVRVMLAFIHFAPWYRNPMRLRLGEDVKGRIEHVSGELDVPVDWVGREEVLGEYLRRGFGNSYDFGQEA